MTLVTVRITRFPNNPIIYPELDESIGTNINGPSLIRVPDWVPNPLGRYYLYFAHHQGQFIRLAFAERLAGPWTIHRQGVLHLSETVCMHHIASPDLQVDEAGQAVRMYFHGPHQGAQVTFLATSRDGLHFTARPEVQGPFYFRVFVHDGWHYAIAKHLNVGGQLLRSKDGLTPFEGGRHILPGMRHVALRQMGDMLQIFYSMTGDAPERILLSQMSLRGDWREWQPSKGEIVLEPELEYEGAGLPVQSSRPGPIHTPVCQLRDPAIYQEDGRTYLLYAVAGESGIAIAELRDV